MIKKVDLVFITYLFIVFIFRSKCVPVLKTGNDLDGVQASNKNPDFYLTPPQIIKRHGYPAEAHIIQSEDGYLLEYHRIPHGKSGKSKRSQYPILLYHGLLWSSMVWIFNGPQKSLAFILADEGYDVWLANSRGNTYSRGHISLTPEQEEFWNYSFHEIGKYDIPAAVDYILNTTNSSKLIHLGYSLGATIFYAFASTRPEYNSKILTHIGVAPFAMLSHTTSAIRILRPFGKQIKSLVDSFSKGALLKHDRSMTFLFNEILCRPKSTFNLCAQLIIPTVFGNDDEQFNRSFAPLILSSMPTGTASKNVVHVSQLILGKFSQYDYGRKENMLHYNSPTPPEYNLSKINIPVKFYQGKNDRIATIADVKLLYQQLPKPLGCTMIAYDHWNHADFAWAKDVNKFFNNDLVLFLRNVTQSPDFILNSMINAYNERLREALPKDNIHNTTSDKEQKFFNEIVDQISNISKNLPN